MVNHHNAVDRIEDYLELQLTTINKRLFPEYCVVPTDDPEKSKKESPPKRTWVFYLGIFFLLSGFIGLFFANDYYRLMRYLNLKLTPGSLRFAMWKENIRPFTMDIYMFNWTNPQDIYNPKKKPIFEEIGPYKFIQVRTKLQEIINENGTATFKQRRLWRYVESPGVSLKDNITTVNAVAMTAGYKTRFDPYFIKAGLSSIFITTRARLHVTKTAAELIYEGYEDKLMSMVRNIPFLPKEMTTEMKNFSWFYGWNNSADFSGVFNVVTDYEDSGRLKTWNYKDNVPMFPGTCGKINGYFGDQFPFDMQKEDLKIFSTEVCRDIDFEYESEVDVQGLPSYKYAVGDKFLDNGTIYPSNECFNGGAAVPSGNTNSSNCWHNSPTFISLPHFYKADPYYLQAVTGMEPDKDKHKMYIAIQPDTGIVTEVKIRAQFNFHLQRYPGIGMFRNVPNVHLPVLWFEQVSGIHPSHVGLIKLLLISDLLSLSVSTLFMIIGFCIVCHYSFKTKLVPKKGFEKLKNMVFTR